MTILRTRHAALIVLPLIFATGLSAQPTLIRDLSPVPQDSIDALIAAGQDLTYERMNSLLGAWVPGAEQVTSVGVVVTDPLNSGLSSWREDEGGPRRLHFYMRDTAAVTLGTAGMGIQIVDSDWRTNGSDGLIPGDVIEVTGLAGRAFETAMVFEHTTVVRLGNFVDFGIPNAILTPDTVTTGDLNMGFGDGTYQSNWANYNDLNGAYVCVDSAMVFRRTVTGQRENWVITSDGGESVLNVYDMSLRFRNDRSDSYLPPFNVRSSDDPFIPPVIGATVRLCGTIVHQGDDPFFLGSPLESSVSIVPWDDSDLTILDSPAQVALSGTVLLEGAYSGSSAMATPPAFHNTIPTIQPYSHPFFDGSVLDYDGGEVATSIDPNMIDWVLVELRDPLSPTIPVARGAAIVLDDGSLADLDGSTPLPISNAMPGHYFVVVCHRNHLCAMSTLVDFTSGSGAFDFTSSPGFAIGPDPQKVLDAGPPLVYGLFAGDANVDGSIQALDYNRYLTALVQGHSGYVQLDFDMDGAVQALDFSLFIANTSAGASSQVP